MSRSCPNENQPNPCTRWHSWNGEGNNGFVEYYDKDKVRANGQKGENVVVGPKFTFLLLDELSSVRGWHDASDSGISSNEVRDTKAERMVVRALKGGILAEGFYANIRDRIKAVGGKFTANLYVVYKAGTEHRLGALQLKGAALNSWVEFSKGNRDALYKQAVAITGYLEGKKGKITFRTPVFALRDIAPETDASATKIDKEVLQPYLTAYFKRTHMEQASQPVGTAEPVEPESLADAADTGSEPPLPSDDAAPF